MLAIFAIALLIIVSGWTSATGGLEMPVPPTPVTTAPWSQPSSGTSGGSGVQEGYDEDGNYIGHPFGTEVELVEGLVVSVAAPEEVTPGEYAELVGGYDTTVRVKVMVRNTGREPIGTADTYVSATTGNRAASEFWDIEQDLGDPYVTVMPGRSMEFYIGFEAYDGDPLVVTVEHMMVDAYAVFSHQ